MASSPDYATYDRVNTQRKFARVGAIASNTCGATCGDAFPSYYSVE